MTQQKQAFCPACGKHTLHAKAEPRGTGCLAHVLLTIVTCGLWIPVALLVCGAEGLGALTSPYHCQACGARLR